MKRIILFTAIMTSFLLMTCNVSSSFDEYSGENFLAGSSLSSEGWQLMPDMDFTSDASGTSASDYMGFTSTGSSGPLGGPVYRLEIKNLLINGDFEAAPANDKDPWDHFDNSTDTLTPYPPASDMNMITGANEIDNVTAFIQTLDSEYIKIDLVTAFSTPQTYVPGKNYFFQFDYRTINPFTLYYIPNWTTSSVLSDENYYQAYGGVNGTIDNPGFSNLNTYPPAAPNSNQTNGNSFTASSTVFASNTDNFSMVGYAEGAQSPQGVYVDNFRIIRSSEGNFDLRLRLQLTNSHRPDLELIDGYYKFALYVKEDGSLPAGSYHADRVELGIEGYDQENQRNVSDYKVFYKTQALANTYVTTTGTYSGDWSSNWVLLEFASSNLIQLSQTSESPVLELSISPSNPGSTDSSWDRLSSGTVLIADPILEYSSTPWE